MHPQKKCVVMVFICMNICGQTGIVLFCTATCWKFVDNKLLNKRLHTFTCNVYLIADKALIRETKDNSLTTLSISQKLEKVLPNSNLPEGI